MSKRVAVVGNCQARPLAAALQRLVPGLEVASTSIVQLLKDEDEPEHARGYESADAIFAMQVRDDYRCTFVRTSTLRERYGEKVKVWPNLYFAGYNPELLYVRDDDHRPISGPLGDYHLRTIHEAWLDGQPEVRAAERVLDVDANRARYESVPAESFAELERRATSSDLDIIGWVRERVWQERLFFTFNHPAWRLIEESARRLALGASLELQPDFEFSPRYPWSEQEPLGQFRAPLNPWVLSAFTPGFDDEVAYRGIATRAGLGHAVGTGKVHEYGLEELVGAFYVAYAGAALSRDP